MEKVKEAYKPKPKYYGERAERISNTEYNPVVQELKDMFSENFERLESVEQLEGKEDFGDIDLVCLPHRTIDRLYFEKILGDKLLDYNRNGHVHSLLIRLSSGKSIQVDFVQSKNEEDFERKFRYYSKGHLSSIVGMFARKLNFKYGTEGFFKRFKDKRGNYHDILISDSFLDGLKILGLDPNLWSAVRTPDDIIGFVSRSPLFEYKWG